jgi:hypothetical protein
VRGQRIIHACYLEQVRKPLHISRHKLQLGTEDALPAFHQKATRRSHSGLR